MGDSCNVAEPKDELEAIDCMYSDAGTDNLKRYVDLLKEKEDVSEVYQHYPEVVNYFNALKEYYIRQVSSITDEQVYEKILEHIRSKQ